MTVDLSKEEIQTLVACMDVTCKSGGLQAAGMLLPLAAKLQQALGQDNASSNADG